MQLALDLGTPPPARFSNFVRGANSEALTVLRALPEWLAIGDRALGQRMIYLWGEPGSGRSHLLQACCAETQELGLGARYLGPHSSIAEFDFSPDAALYAVDDVDQLDAGRQVALFRLYNEVLAQPGHGLVAAGPGAPLSLTQTLREDLRSRLGWGMVHRVQTLSDEEKIAALRQAAHDRGLNLSADVPVWLLTNFRRDLPSLMGLLDALDSYSLEKKRAITLPLVRNLLKEIWAAGA